MVDGYVGMALTLLYGLRKVCGICRHDSNHLRGIFLFESLVVPPTLTIWHMPSVLIPPHPTHHPTPTPTPTPQLRRFNW